MFVPWVLDAAGRLGPGCCDVSVQAVENRVRLCGKYHHLQFIFRGKLFDTEVSTCLTSIDGMKLLHVGIYVGDDAEACGI